MLITFLTHFIVQAEGPTKEEVHSYITKTLNSRAKATYYNSSAGLKIREEVLIRNAKKLPSQKDACSLSYIRTFKREQVKPYKELIISNVYNVSVFFSDLDIDSIYIEENIYDNDRKIWDVYVNTLDKEESIFYEVIKNDVYKPRSFNSYEMRHTFTNSRVANSFKRALEKQIELCSEDFIFW